MNNRVSLVAIVLMALSALALVAVIGSSAYTAPAGVEARGMHALSNTVAQALRTAPAPPTLSAAVESGR